MNAILFSIAIASGLLATFWCAIRLVRHLQMKNTNTALWGEVMDSFSQKAISCEPIKTPEIYVEKKARRDGKDIDADAS